MKLITKAVEKAAPPLDSTGMDDALQAAKGYTIGDRTVVAKFFDPTGRFTFYMLEYDPKQRLGFGWVVSPLGPDCDELGYVSIDELEGVKGAFGLGIERDRLFSPKPLGDVAPHFKEDM